MPYYRTLTLDHTQAGSADTANYPCLWRGNASLATVANGGRVTSSSGYDIIFCTDPSHPLSTILPFERVIWSASTGLGEFHVNVGTLTHSSSLVVYVYYGDATITSDQQNVNGTWNSNYKAVIHFPTGSSITSSNVVDSTSNGNVLNSDSGSPTLTTGLIGQAYSGNTTSDSVFRLSATFVGGGNPMSVSSWFKLSSAPSSAPSGGALTVGTGGNATLGRFGLFMENSLIGGYFSTAVTYGAWSWDTSWHYGVLVYPSGASSVADVLIYLDGSLVTITTPGSGALNVDSGGSITVGSVPEASTVFNFPGLIDEARFAGEVSASQVLADYNSQMAGSTFVGVGSEQTAGGGFQPAWGLIGGNQCS
jgi:hypothetical protein